MISSLRISVFIGICAIAYSCATPSSPTGGPPDEEPPEIIASEPETGTVNFEGNEIVLHFSEFVERGSLSEALTIEPEIGLLYGLDWGRKSVTITFDEALPDSTTMIATVGTDFSDLDNNSIGSPFKVAFSTGPDIDEGKLIGRVRDARTGEGTEGNRVLLYRSPIDLSLPANYIGETDTSGVVNFSYLSEGKYKAFWVDDRNRNKVWDPKQERAQPFKKEFISLKKAGEDTLGSLYIAGSDTSKPVLQGIGLFSSQRLRLRFSENIMLSDSSRLSIRDDSTGSSAGEAYPLYILPGERYVLFAQNSEALAPDRSYKLTARNIADPAGNVQDTSSYSFTGSAQEDTTQQRIGYSSVGEGIFPDQSIEVTYAKPIGSAVIRDSLKVVAGDTVLSPWKNLEINRNTLRILPEGQWKKGVDYEFRIWNPAAEDYSTISPTIWYETDLGALNITFADTTDEAAQRPSRLLLQTSTGTVVADTAFTGQIEMSGLAPVDHQLTLFQDLNANGRWDQGTVDPFKRPEPYFIRNEIPVQGGFTSDLEVSFEN